MELITTHTHSNFCGHAKDSVEDMVSAAEAAGATTYAITEHYPLTATFDPNGIVGMAESAVDSYVETVRRQQALHPEMQILCGCELDWLGNDEDRVLKPEDFDRFELVLGSVHYVDKWAFDDPDVADRWEIEGPDGIWRRYVELWCDAVTSNAPFTVMTHPDLVKKFGYYPDFNTDKLFDRMAEAAASSERMIEVNTSGAFYPCKEMYPSPALLQRFCKAGIPCTIGSDAHEKANVVRGIEAGYRYMYEAGYRYVTVPTRDGDRRTVKIEP